jgi:hypothetical protein
MARKSRSDDARSVATNPDAPQGERQDAELQLAKATLPSNGMVEQMRALMPDIASIGRAFEERELFKSLSEQDELFESARGSPIPKQGMRSVYLDELQAYTGGDYYEKPSDLGFDACRSLVDQVPVLAAVIRTRVRQVARFTSPSEDGGLGFEIRHQDRQQKLTGDDKAGAQLLTKFIQNCGWEFNPRKRKRLKRDSFAQFMSKSVADSLALDSCPIETELKRGRNSGIDGFYAVDGTTIRLCTEDGYDGDDDIYALQVVQQRPVTSFTRDELIYEVRNPRSDVRCAGYGQSESEWLVKIIAGYLNAMTYNISGFDNNAIPKGVLNITGDYGPDDQAAFKRYWAATCKGVDKGFALPVLFSKDGVVGGAKFERFGVEFNEMYFSKWMTFLTAIICAVYGIAPDEINFEAFSNSKSSLSGSDTTERLADSKDKGLRPLLSFYEAMISDYIISDFDDRLCFRWVGLDQEDPGAKATRDIQTLTLNELRSRNGDAPFPDPELGDAPLNPTLIGPWQALRQQRAAAQQQAQGQGGQDGLDFGDGDQGGAPGEQDGFGKPPGGQVDPGASDGERGQEGQGSQPKPGEPGNPATPGGQPPGPPTGDDENPEDDDNFGKALGGAAVWAING